ncbi:ImmA/IrrE family metallo-endopeptidase [Terribacillus sp. JSM ZJ617]|uniref:ImmA/IrrE family metallo-endopeptidase n=1 Tax=Terribacillus sp. JSM ZJ617 TaxID=3342119 RepID=UPI0035A891E3
MIPTNVIIGGMNYTVKEVEDLTADNDIYGQVTYHNNKISIDEYMADERKEAVFVHEMFHAVMFEAGYDEQDEEMVRRVSNVLYQVLKDNDFSYMNAKAE